MTGNQILGWILVALYVAGLVGLFIGPESITAGLAFRDRLVAVSLVAVGGACGVAMILAATYGLA